MIMTAQTSYLGEGAKRLRALKRRVSEALYGSETPSWPGGDSSLELVYWRPKAGTNFGDELSRVVVQLMLAKRGMTPQDKLSKPQRMLAIGSVLHLARTGSVIWGTGRNGVIPDRAHFFDRLDVRAVRGPRTADFLTSIGISAPKIYGDPALLLPALIGGRFRTGAVGGPVFVPNLNDFRAGVDFESIKVPVIDPRQNWNIVVAEILKYDLVLASSLHGLVIAEAFGLPARYVRVSEEEAPFKYLDYHEGTGRTGLEWASSIPEALEMGGMPGLSRLEDITSGLTAAFPYDLWQEADSPC